MATYYNDNEPYVCEWLRNLQLAGPLSQGDVECAPIQQVEAWQLVGYTRCHFFAGIGGWDYALQLAGWPEEQEVWTGSCPCQPFSVAGQRKGINDERHLWPIFYGLIKQRRPATIFGEQVASADGRKWLAGVFADLEALGYTVAGADLCAAGVGAPHIRQRLYWVANTNGRVESNGKLQRGRQYGQQQENGSASGVAVSESEQQHRSGNAGRRRRESSDGSRLVIPKGEQVGFSRQSWQPRATDATERNCATFWDNSELIQCADGKERRIEPGTSPLANGVSARVGKLRAYGNAIVPQVAATFIKAFLEI